MILIIVCFLRHNVKYIEYTERSLNKRHKDRDNSCPDIVQQLHRDTDRLANSNWRYTGSTQPVYPDPYRYRNDQQTQTEIQNILQVKDTGAQYSPPSHIDENLVVPSLTQIDLLKGQKI